MPFPITLYVYPTLDQSSYIDQSELTIGSVNTLFFNNTAPIGGNDRKRTV